MHELKFTGFRFMTEDEKKEAYDRGVSFAKSALINATRPLMLQDECGFNETRNIESMGWNSIYASDENQALWKKESERINQKRKSFEDGCLCFKEGHIEKKGADTSDIEAIIYYKLACKCSRSD